MSAVIDARLEAGGRVDGTVVSPTKGKVGSFYGTEGGVHVNRGKFEFILGDKTKQIYWEKVIDKPTSMEREVTLTERDAKIKLYNSKTHFQDFLDSVAARKKPIVRRGGRRELRDGLPPDELRLPIRCEYPLGSVAQQIRERRHFRVAHACPRS